MDNSYQFLVTIGSILLVGLIVSNLARHTFLPRVTLLLIFGAAIGKQGLDLIPHIFEDRFDLIADMTLLMVGFLLGGKLTRKSLRGYKRKVFWISISAAAITALLVSLSLIVLSVSIEIAVILGCIASATAPAAVLDVVTESESRGKFSSLLLSIVALDDIWALMLFGMGMAIVGSMNGNGGESYFAITASLEIGGALLLGLLIGLPAAFLTGRIKSGEPILTEAVGIVFLCGGLAIWLEVSYLIAAMAMGAVIANLASHHTRPFHAIEGIEWPFMVIFFFLAGASLEIHAIREVGIIGGAYILARSLGKYLGGRLGSILGGASKRTQRWVGTALLPQAGVAIGMALVASNQYPEYRQALLPIVIGSTVFFEIFGPIFTRMAIRKSGEDTTL